MTTYRRYPQQPGSPFGNWIGIIVGIVLIFALFFVVRGIFKLLYFIAPVLLIATLIVDYKVVISYLKQLAGLWKRNALWGLGATAFTFFLYPIVFAVLLFRALGGRGKARFFESAESNRDEYTDYEIIDEELDLEDLDKVKQKEKRYDDYFRGE